MKSSKRRLPDKPAGASPASTPQATASTGIPWWAYGLGVFAAIFVAFEIYQPTFRAPFLFDDLYLPFTDPNFAKAPLRYWIQGVRPLLMFSYWLTYQSAALDPVPYHSWNILFHVVTSYLTWMIARELLRRVGELGWRREILALFAGALFLAHPLQTESVSYVASRSETLSVMCAYGAIAAFVCRNREAIGLPRALLVLALCGCAAITKEHTAVVPAVFILADLYWGRAPQRKALLRNWKLYAPIVAIPIIVTPLLVKALRYSDTAGFNMKDLPWNHYFFTQCRAVWVYLRLFLAPYGQNIDYDYPISRSLFEHGAVFGLAGLLALAALAFHFRKRFPLASFGYFVFLALLAPTSSLVPIRDVLVERRTYLPFIGLVLIVVELLRFVKLNKPQLLSLTGLVIAALCVATYQRNVVWSDPLLLWRDAAEKSPLKPRPRFQYAYALYSVSQCAQSAREYEKAAALTAPDVRLLVDWAMALECNQQYPEAIEKLQLALAQTRTAHLYSVIGMIRARQGQIQEAWDSLDMAVRLDPGFPMAHFYRGNLHASGGDWAKAAEEYRTALVFSPDLTAAREGLVRAETNLAAAARKKQ